MKRTLFPAALGIVGMLFASAGLAGAAPISEVNQVSDFPEAENGTIGWTTVAAHPNGNTLVVYFGWEVELGTSEDSLGYHYAQLLDPSGAPLNDPVRIEPGDTNYYFSAPTVLYNPVTDGFSAFLIPVDADVILHQAINADGSLDGPRTTVWEQPDDVNGGNIQWSQANAQWVASRNHFLFSIVGETEVSVIQWITMPVASDGSLLDEPVMLGGASETGYNGDSAYSPTSDRALLVAPGQIDSGDVSAPVGHLVDGNGNRVGDTIRIIPNSEASRIAGVGVAWNSATDQFLVVWTSHRNNDCVAATEQCGMWGQLIDHDGTLVGDRITFATTTDADIQYSRPQLDANGFSSEYVVVWHVGPGWNAGTNVWAVRLDTNGEVIEEEFSVSDSHGGRDSYHQRPAVAFNPTSCTYVVTWQGTPVDTNSQHIYSRTIETGETCVLPSTGLQTTTLVIGLAMLLSGAAVLGGTRRRRLA